MNRLLTITTRHPIVATLTVSALVAFAAYLAFGLFGVHLLFVDEVVQEADPFAAAPELSGTDARALPDPPPAAVDGPMDGDGVSGLASADGPIPEPMPDQPQILAAGEFIDRSHPTSGRAEVLADGTGRVLRLEDLMTDNGPDLNVYLVAAPADADPAQLAVDAVDLGDLKGNIGNQNYAIPDGVNLDRYTTVVIWCVRFGVAFGTAGLA